MQSIFHGRLISTTTLTRQPDCREVCSLNSYLLLPLGRDGGRRGGREWLYMYLEKGPLQEWLSGRDGGSRGGREWCAGTWRRDLRQEWLESRHIAIGVAGGSPGDGSIVTLTGRRERELPLKYFHQKGTRFFSGLSSNSSHSSLIHRQTSQIHWLHHCHPFYSTTSSDLDTVVILCTLHWFTHFTDSLIVPLPSLTQYNIISSRRPNT